MGKWLGDPREAKKEKLRERVNEKKTMIPNMVMGKTEFCIMASSMFPLQKTHMKHTHLPLPHSVRISTLVPFGMCKKQEDPKKKNV